MGEVMPKIINGHMYMLSSSKTRYGFSKVQVIGPELFLDTTEDVIGGYIIKILEANKPAGKPYEGLQIVVPGSFIRQFYKHVD